MIRFGKGQRGITGEHLYKHFFEDGHKVLEKMVVKIIDKTNINDPTNREGFLVLQIEFIYTKSFKLEGFFVMY